MPEVVDLEILSRVKSEAIKLGLFLNERRAKKWKKNLKWERSQREELPPIRVCGDVDGEMSHGQRPSVWGEGNLLGAQERAASPGGTEARLQG